MVIGREVSWAAQVIELERTLVDAVAVVFQRQSADQADGAIPMHVHKDRVQVPDGVVGVCKVCVAEVIAAAVDGAGEDLERLLLA